VGLSSALQQGRALGKDQREVFSAVSGSSLHASVRESMFVWFSNIEIQGEKLLFEAE